jgi:FkbM family methyltransferase
MCFSLADYRLHNTGRLEGDGPVRISTPPQRWAYAVEFPARQDAAPSSTGMVVTIDLTVRAGTIGVACVAADGAILVESECDSRGGDTPVELSLPSGVSCRTLIVRNTSPDGVASHVEIRSIRVHEAAGEACREIALDPAIWARFTPWSGLAPAGYVMDWVGVRTRADIWQGTAGLPEYREERWEVAELETDGRDVLDWVALLAAVQTAGDTFVVVELGAGWGKWLAAAAAVASRTGRDYRLLGVEAEPTHFAWLARHLDDNGIDRGRCRLVEAAVGARAGACWFRIGRPVEWYGQSIAADAGVAAGDDAPLGTVVEGPDATLRRTRLVDLDEVLADIGRVDYLHMDIQGSELDVLSANPRRLHERVRMLTVATHSELIDRGLRRLFTSLGWVCRYEVPLRGVVLLRIGASAARVQFLDGFQLWINPALEEETSRRS